MSENTRCPGCGAKVDHDESSCPYCGRAIRIMGEARPLAGAQIFRAQQSSEGNLTIDFGDGEVGRRPESGANSGSVQYREGMGRQMATCPQCDHKQREGSFKCERCGAYLKRF